MVCGEVVRKALGHDWADATCTEPKTCIRCGATEGEALGHQAGEASCTEAAVCTVCGEVLTELVGHDWTDATCTEPKICARCGQTEGKPLGHDWEAATATRPKTCKRCGEAEGDPLITYYWNEPVQLGTTDITAGFYDDGQGNYRFEMSSPSLNSKTLYLLLKENQFREYGLTGIIYDWMQHIMDDYRDFYRQGDMVYYSLNGLGNKNLFYFNFGDKKGNGFLCLELNYSMDWLHDGIVKYRDPAVTPVGVSGGQTAGTLSADYEKLGYTSFLKDLKGYFTAEFNSPCYDYPSIRTTGSLTVTNLGTVNAAEYQRKLRTDMQLLNADGYEWKGIQIDYRSSDRNTDQYGFLWKADWRDDYYHAREDLSDRFNGEDQSESMEAYSVVWNGTEYDNCVQFHSESGDWEGSTLHIVAYTLFRVPTGYDGTIAIISDGSTSAVYNLSAKDIMAQAPNSIFLRVR